MKIVFTLLLAPLLCLGSEGRSARDVISETEVERIEYKSDSVEAAFEGLAEMAQEADPDGLGINIIYKGPTGDDAPKITLTLRNVSLYDAIRYICEVSELHYRLDKNAVVISDKEAPSERIVTRFYPVMPTFMDAIRDEETERQRDRASRLRRWD